VARRAAERAGFAQNIKLHFNFGNNQKLKKINEKERMNKFYPLFLSFHLIVVKLQ
jgi:hypothetical protein